MTIKIKIRSMQKLTYLEINDETKQLKVNGKLKNVNVDEFVSSVLKIVSSWSPSLINSEVLDGESYSVEIFKDGKTYDYLGSNKFPVNYNEFKKLVNWVINYE